MKKIRNPNEIVDAFVADCRESFGDRLISVIMYGAAVTHEYVPGKSAIKLAIILTDTKLSTISDSVSMQKKWIKSGIDSPLFLSLPWINSSLDTLPIEYLDLQTNYRVVYGDDSISGIVLDPVHMRLFSERELRKCALSLRQHYVLHAGDEKVLQRVLIESISSMEPIFKTLVVIKERKIPYSSSDMIALVEDLYGLGPSVLSEILYSKNVPGKHRFEHLFLKYVEAVDSLLDKVDALEEELNSRETL